jgi:arginine deiminase
MPANEIKVTSEIGRLRRLLIHSPDGGIGKVIPAKFKEWLYDDTVQLSQMRKDYNDYIKLLLYFLDPEKVELVKKAESEELPKESLQYDCYKPDKPTYFNSDKVLDSQYLLSQILHDEAVKKQIISAVCAWEGTGFRTEKKLLSIQSPFTLAKVLITGILHDENGEDVYIFQPLPNFIFTRDIGITINDQLLLSNAATPARERESMLMRFISQYHLFKGREDALMEVSEPGNYFLTSEEDQSAYKISVEGGDVMMIAPNHLLVGCSERTTAAGINEIIHTIFKNNKTGIEKISVIKIPRHRSVMHIDTVFTQVKRNVWVLFGQFSEKYNALSKDKAFSYRHLFLQEGECAAQFKIEIYRFYKPLNVDYDATQNYQCDIQDRITGIESLLHDISINDFNVKPEDVKVIYSGDGVFPYDEREQWTDSCNLLALKEGVVIGYDRNEKTIKAFENNGFTIYTPEQLFELFEQKVTSPDDLENALIVLHSSELSRARGGAHCMSCPLLRDEI